MFVEKKKVAVNVFLSNGLLVKGLAHLNEGERLQELCNDSKRDVIPITKVAVFHAQWPKMEKIESELVANRETVLINKRFVVWFEEDRQEK